MSTAQLDPQRQRKAREYARTRRRLLLADLAFALSGALALLLALSRHLAALIEQVTANPWLEVPLYMAIVSAAYSAATFPLSYYAGFVLPHRYGLSVQALRGWLSDQAKGAALGAALGLPLVEGLYWLLRTAPATWWIGAGVGMVAVTVGLSTLAPVLILPLFYQLTPLDDAELVKRLTRLAQRAGTRVKGAYTLDFSSRTTAANAGLMGLGRTRRIVVGDTLQDNYTAEEIESLLAHELGHHVHHDIGWSIVVNAALTLGGLWLASRALRWGVWVFGFHSPGDVAAFPLLALATFLFGLITLPLGNAYSRWRERLADQFALQVTGHPQAFSRAMLKLADQNLAEMDPEQWVVWLLYSHPPIRERVAMADHLLPDPHGDGGEGEGQQKHHQHGQELARRVELGDLIQEQGAALAEEEEQPGPQEPALPHKPQGQQGSDDGPVQPPRMTAQQGVDNVSPVELAHGDEVDPRDHQACPAGEGYGVQEDIHPPAGQIASEDEELEQDVQQGIALDERPPGDMAHLGEGKSQGEDRNRECQSGQRPRRADGQQLTAVAGRPLHVDHGPHGA